MVCPFYLPNILIHAKNEQQRGAEHPNSLIMLQNFHLLHEAFNYSLSPIGTPVYKTAFIKDTLPTISFLSRNKNHTSDHVMFLPWLPGSSEPNLLPDHCGRMEGLPLTLKLNLGFI